MHYQSSFWGFPVPLLVQQKTAGYTDEEWTAKPVNWMAAAQFNIWRAVKLA